MKFTNKQGSRINENDILRILNKSDINDITKEDLKTLIGKDILPIINRSEREDLLKNTLSLWIDDYFEYATLVGYIDIKLSNNKEFEEMVKRADDEYGDKIYIEEW